MTAAATQGELELPLANPCPCCEGRCGYYVRVIYLFAGAFNEWRWCRMCKATGSAEESNEDTDDG